jgi:hypothetical protein
VAAVLARALLPGPAAAGPASNPPSCVGTASRADLLARVVGGSAGGLDARGPGAVDGRGTAGGAEGAEAAAGAVGETGVAVTLAVDGAAPAGLARPSKVAERKLGFEAFPPTLLVLARGGRGGDFEAEGAFVCGLPLAPAVAAAPTPTGAGAAAGIAAGPRSAVRVGISAPGAGAAPVFATKKDNDSLPVDSPTVESGTPPTPSVTAAAGSFCPTMVGTAGALGMAIPGAAGAPLIGRCGGTVGASRVGSTGFAFAPSPPNVPRPAADGGGAGFAAGSRAGGATLAPGRGRGTDSEGRGGGGWGLMRRMRSDERTSCRKYAPGYCGKAREIQAEKANFGGRGG